MITQQTGQPGLKRGALKRILDQDFDVVHFHNISLVGGPGLLKMSRAPVTLYTTHEHWLFCPTHVLWKYRSRPCEKPQCFSCSLVSGRPPQLWRYTRLVPDALAHVDCLLVPSRFTARKHREAGIDAPMRVLPFFSPIQTESAGRARPPDDPLFAYTGRLEKSKGVEQLLQSFADRPDYRLHVAGGGSLDDSLRRRFSACPNIRFLGILPHEQIKTIVSNATATIVPAWGPEVFPLSVLESMSCGVPVIVRRAGGSAEPLEMGGGGWIYDRPEELAPLLDRLVADPKLVTEQGIAAFKNAQRNFRIETWMERYFELIGQIRAAKPK